MKTTAINALPVKTWGFLGMNEARCEIRQSVDKHSEADFCSQYGENKTSRVTVTSGEMLIRLNAEKCSTLTVFVTVEADDDVNIKIESKIDSGAEIKIVFAALEGMGKRLIVNIESNVDESGSLTLYSLFSNTGEVFAEHKTTLRGDDSRLDSRTFYLAGCGEKLDLNYITEHWGRGTKSETVLRGAVDDGGSKTFKGTIDLKKGAAGSVGTETENVLLLGDNVENKTLPVILCAEEDVRGEHGATIGDLSDETLFYFMSRGFSESDAKTLLKSSIADAFCRTVNDDETTLNVYTKMGWDNE